MPFPFITILILLAVAVSALGSSKHPSPYSWEGWKCDDLTPDLCELDVNVGIVAIHGVSVHYWKYSRRNGGDSRQLMDEPQELPVIVINGGPSWAHNYMLPLRQLACRGNRDVIFYDQAGCGASVLPVEADIGVDYPWLWDLNYYATEELPALISHLALDRFHIVGHSWGTMVAQVYAIDGPKQGLQSMALSGPISDAHLVAEAMWGEKGAHGGISSMPPYLESRIRAVEEQGAFDSPEYEALDNAFLNMFLTRVQPLPDCLVDALSGMNIEAYLGLFGPNDFVFGGTVKDYNVTGRLEEIHVPVLLSNGEYDFVRPAVVDVMEQKLPIVERVLFEKSAHNTMQDSAGEMNDVLFDFLGRVETSVALKKKFRRKKLQGRLMNLLPASMEDTAPSSGGAKGSVLVMATSFIVGIVVGAFLNTQSVRKLGYESL